MKRKTITVDEIMAANPCTEYPSERVQALFGKRKRVTVEQLADSDIPMSDRMWAIEVPGVFFTDGEWVLYARWCALQVTHLWDVPDVVMNFLRTGENARGAADAAYASAAAYAADDTTRAADATTRAAYFAAYAAFAATRAAYFAADATRAAARAARAARAADATYEDQLAALVALSKGELTIDR